MQRKEHKSKVELYKNIGRRLLTRRKELQYTQEKVAEMLEVSTGFYGMIERGEKSPSIEKLVMIHEKLGIDITYLLTGEERALNYIEKWPQKKQYEFKQLIRYALSLMEET